MRFYRKCEILLSVDDLTVPKKVRFGENLEFTDTGDTAILKEGGSTTQSIPASQTDYPLPMGKVTQGGYFYLFSSKNFTLKVGSTGSAISVRANMPCEMWATYDALLVSTGVDATELTWCIAGE